MGVLLLKPKLYIPPPRPGLVLRQRLIERLNERLWSPDPAPGGRFGRKLTLISAPAGFGKTTLLGEWVHATEAQHAPLRVAWVSLDQDDNDPAHFWSYVIAALQTVRVGVGQAILDGLGSSGWAAGAPPIEVLLTDLINEIVELAEPLVLVLDDLHLVTEQQVHRGIVFLLHHLPPHMHLVLCSRADPPWPLARLRARREVTELRMADLRFTPEEAAAFLNESMHLGLSSPDVAVLGIRTEGWIAGLQMAGLAMQSLQVPQGPGGVPGDLEAPVGTLTSGPAGKPADRSAFVAALSGTERFILDYLVEEVLSQQPAAVQEFLLKTSILERLVAPLCDAILGEGWEPPPAGDERIVEPSSAGSHLYLPSPSASQTILEHLEQANLFIVPLDTRREWYRYHRLFADLLRQRLHRLYPPSQEAGQGIVPALHRRASEWYESQGYLADAIEHALAAGDDTRAADLIEAGAGDTLMRSEVLTFLHWVEALPGELVRARPFLCLYQAWALFLSGRSLESVEARLQDLGKDPELAAGRVAPLRAFVAIFQGQVGRAAELSHQALEQLPEREAFLRSIAAWELGMCHLVSRDFETGRRLLDEAARISQKAGNVMIAVMTLCNLAELHMAEGHLDRARETYGQALERATSPQGRRFPVAGMALIGLGDLFREWNDVGAAVRYLEEGIELVKQWGEIGAIDGYVAMARLRQSQGDVVGVRDAMHEAQQLALKFDATEIDDVMVAMHQARLWIAQGDLEAAAHWVEERGLKADAGLAELEGGDAGFDRHIRRREYIVLARQLIAQGQPAEALSLLELLLPLITEHGSRGRVIELHLLKALALQAQGELVGALAALERALSLAEPGGYVRIFVDEGPPMARLLYRAAGGGAVSRYVGELLAAFDLERVPEAGHPPASAQAAGARPGAEWIEPLSEREIEVLQLVAEGFTNREVAQQLALSLPTIKWHTSNIYGKLAVKNRTEAVARARALGILSTV
jgi:LuxR family maltose regulon positive regulatory protein